MPPGRRSSFLRNLLSNLLIVLAVAMMLLPLSMHTSRLVRSQEIRDRRSSLQNGLDLLTQQISSLESLLTQSKSNDYFNRIAIIGKTRYASDYYAMRSTQQYLAAIASAGAPLVDVIAYFGNSGIILTQRNAFDGIASFTSFYSLEGIDLEASLQSVSDASPRFRCLPGGTIASPNLRKTAVAFCYQLPLVNTMTAASRNHALLLFDREMLLNLLLSDSLRQSGCLTLRDGQGQALMDYRAEGFDAPPAADAPGESIAVHNGHGTLSCTAFLPESYFAATLWGVHRFIALCLAACLLVGFLAAYYAAWRQGLPMRRLLAEFESHGLGPPQNPDEYAWLKANMLRMQSENRSVVLQLEQYHKQQQAVTLDRLLSGALHTDAQFSDALEQLESLPLPCLVGYGRVHLGDRDRDSGDDVRTVLMIDALRDQLPRQALLHMVDANAFALLFPLAQDAEAASAQLRKILSRFQSDEPTHHTILLAVSKPCETLRQIHPAFERARIRYATATSHDLLLTPDSPMPQEETLSLRMLQQLHNSLLAAEEAAACDSLRRMLFLGAPPQADMATRYATLRMILLMAWNEIRPSQPLNLPPYRPSESPEALSRTLSGAALALCRAVVENNRRRHSERGNMLEAHMRAHYTESTFCPASLAEAFQVSEKTLYTLFKEQTGQSPAAYLQDLRMEHATRLLRETDLPAQQISDLSGFSSFNTYYKAFKRLYAVTPSQYRTQARERAGDGV